MDVADALAAIRARLTAQWTTTSIAWPNEPFTPPDVSAVNAAWVGFDFAGSLERIAAVGGAAKLYQGTGVFMLHVFVRAQDGLTLAYQHATALAAIFRGQIVGGVRYGAPSTYPSDTTPDGAWQRVTLGVPFSFYSND